MVKFWTKNQNSFGIEHQKLGISTKKGKGETTERENAQKLKSQSVDLVDQAVDQDQDWSIGWSGLGLLSDSRASFSRLFPLVLQELCRFNCQRVIFEVIAANWRLWIGFLGRSKARVLVFDCILFLLRVTVSFLSISRCLGFQLWMFLSLPAHFPLFHSFLWLLDESWLPLGHKTST